MKKLAITIGVVIVVLLGILILWAPAQGPTVSPGASSTGGGNNKGGSGGIGTVRGSVLLGPTCPVERIPPDPACAPKPYQTLIAIEQANAAVRTIESDLSGAFSVSLPAGNYVFHPQGAAVYPRCEDKSVQVTAVQTSNITINCDTGIR